MDNFFTLVSIKSSYFRLKYEVLVASSVFGVSVFSPINKLFLEYPYVRSTHILKFDPNKVWYSIFFSKLVDCIFFKIVKQHVCFVKDRGTYCSWERNINISAISSEVSHIFLSLLLRQLKEKWCCPVFTRCGEPCNLDENTKKM